MKKRVYLLLGLFLLCLSLVGCLGTENNNGFESDAWEDEVLLAQDCGLDNMPCCLNQEPSCQFELRCCTDPVNGVENYCAETCTCGELKNFCCAGEEACNDGMTCVNGRCEVCGNLDEPCCSGESRCSEDLICHQDACVKCGEPGNPCCESGKTCLGENKEGKGRAECYDGLCVYCGYNGGVACPSEPQCAKRHILNNNFCLSCGGENQPCCQQDEQNTEEKCDTSKGLVCELGFCSRQQHF